mmetsp:Transcript_28616/g.35066  ORF Transcript_28616/g.35066 Transcript_28616/m.35066 type:complete len:746 (+) Transcript_28616:27-2264(+)
MSYGTSDTVQCWGKDCMEPAIPPQVNTHPWLAIMFSGLYGLLFFIILFENIYQSWRNKYSKLRLMLLISATFELGFCILQPISFKYYGDYILGLIARMIPFQTYLWLSLTGYYIVAETIRAINFAIKSRNEKYPNLINNIWTLIIVIHVILNITTMILVLITKTEKFEALYYFYLTCTVFLGMDLVIFVSMKVKRKLNKYLQVKRKSKGSDPYIRVQTDTPTMNDNRSATASNDPNSGWKGPKFDALEERSEVGKLTTTIYNLKIIIGVCLVIDAISVVSCVFTGYNWIRYKDSKIPSHAPYRTYVTLCLHYCQIYATYIGIVYYTWIHIPWLECFSKRKHKVSRHSIAFCIQTKCCCCCHRNSYEAKVKQEMVLTPSSDGSITNSGHTDASIQTIDVFLYANTNGKPKATSDTDNNEDSDSNHLAEPTVGYTINSNQRINPDTKNIPLERVTSDGQRMGKKWTGTVKKLSKEEAKQKRDGAIIPTIDNTIKKTGTIPSKLTPAVTPWNGLGLNNALAYASDDETVVNNNELDKTNITLIIVEYDEVFGTTIDRLSKIRTKPHVWVKREDQRTLDLMFGGPERLNKLKEMFMTMFKVNKAINTQNTVEGKLMIFGISKFSSKAIIELSSRVGINKYLESEISGRRLSHIVGYESRLQQTNKSRHQLIFKLMTFLKKKGENVLYISRKSNDSDHIKTINVCHVYNIKTSQKVRNGGMIQEDMTTIIDKYFHYNESEYWKRKENDAP